jgi:hypothetical protein
VRTTGEEDVMTTLAEPTIQKPDRRDIASRLLVPEFWASLTIITMWLAVLFDGVFGGDMVFTNPPKITTIPSAVIVAIFAAIGTSAVAKRAFGRDRVVTR